MATNLPPILPEAQSAGARDRRAAWDSVLSNLVLPGLGTFIARRRLAGVLQLVVSQCGFVFMMVWAVGYVREWWTGKAIPPDLGPRFGLGLLGIALFFLAWIWSLASSAGILQDSRTSGL